MDMINVNVEELLFLDTADKTNVSKSSWQAVNQGRTIPLVVSRFGSNPAIQVVNRQINNLLAIEAIQRIDVFESFIQIVLRRL